MESLTREQAEQAELIKFASAYVDRCGCHLDSFVKREKPDFEATIQETGRKIGIEFTGLFQDERQAKINYNERLEWGSHILEVDKIVEELNRLLIKKIERVLQYEFEGKIILAIWVGSFIFNTPQDFLKILPRINVPESRFSEIWLVLQQNDISIKPVLMSLLEPGTS